MPSTPEPCAAVQPDQQDLVNMLLAAAMQATAALSQTRRAARLPAAEQPQIAADLDEAARALVRIRDMMLRAADQTSARGD